MASCSRLNLERVDFKKPTAGSKISYNEEKTDTSGNVIRQTRARSNLKISFDTTGAGKENGARQLRSDLSDSNLSLAMKDAASKTITTVKTAFDNLSTKLRKSTRKRRILTNKPYKSLENNTVTPVKLYSPFGIATPSPSCSTKNFQGTPGRRGKFTPRRFDFNSPTGQLKRDICDISSAMDDLNVVASKVQMRARKNI